ncbi:TonB-dependent receptor [Sphingomonas sp.]|uniref:TonB-dependent receptor n=1 Tax=Sphingomonas sp. TaxID=28214 RepID=UPI0038A12767
MPALDALPQAPAIVVVGTREAAQHTPNTKESADAAQLRTTTNVRNTEDALRYFPSLFVRKRHIGDTQAPLATRTSGVGASARSLVYADGVLLSALIGNNNNFASPRWGMVSPEEIDRVDVLYGPFSAAYPGNSIGAVVNIITRMPETLEASATGAWNLQKFDQYATPGSYPAYQLAGTIGDRMGPLAWFISANHVDSKSQPLAYVTVARPGLSAGGTSVTGAFPDLNRTGAPIFVLGAGGFEHQKQDNLKAKLRLDLPDSLRLTWQSGLFLNRTDSNAETYLTDAAGNPVYSGTLNIAGQRVTVPASAFSSQVYKLDERHWMHSATLEQSGRTFSWWLIGSLYDYANDDQRIPSAALPAGSSGGAGSIVRMKGTGWRTLDFHGFARLSPAHQLHGGAHYDGFTLRSRRFAASDWSNAPAGALTQESLGRTRTFALWGEEEWTASRTLMLTLGARYEWWKAFGGRIFPLSAPASSDQPSRTESGLSPKASLRWEAVNAWTATLSGGRALRFPTVSELYQSVSVGAQQRSPDPNLKPEKAWSAELAVEHPLGNDGRVRLSLFHERIRDALLSQTALFPGTQTSVSFVQNIPRTRTSGAELVVEKRNLVPRLDVSGSLTLADPKVVSDPAVPSAEGKLIPQVPRRKATLVATWRPTEQLSLTAAARYSSRLFGTINNADIVGHTYQGFEGYFVADARMLYHLTPKVDVAAGVENLTDKRYFLFHPFPDRTFTAELHWHL